MLKLTTRFVLFSFIVSFSFANAKEKNDFWNEGKLDIAIHEEMRVPNFADLAEKLNPSVVNISTTEIRKGQNPLYYFFGNPRGDHQNPFHDFFGDDSLDNFFGGQGMGPKEYTQRIDALGSGFIMSSDGYIITNNHVVEHASEIKVILKDEKKYDAKVIGKDKETDVALIKIDAKNLPAAYFGDSDKMRVGDWVLAIGNPFGLGHTVTQGIISAKGREIGLGNYENFIQTDASINPGNSGGPLFNVDGQVIGINTAIVAGGSGIGFAIPVNLAKDVLKSLREKGTVIRGFLGVSIQKITEDIQKAFKLSTTQGALVSDVVDDSPAAKAGIQKGDVITEFNGRAIHGAPELSRLAAATPVGSKVSVKILRESQPKSLMLTIAKKPKDFDSLGSKESEGGAPVESKLGISVEELTRELSQSLNYKNEEGVVVSNVDSNSDAAVKGIRPGDLIKKVGNRTIRFLADFNASMKGLKKGEVIALLVRSSAMPSTRFVVLEVE